MTVISLDAARHAPARRLRIARSLRVFALGGRAPAYRVSSPFGRYCEAARAAMAKPLPKFPSRYTWSTESDWLRALLR